MGEAGRDRMHELLELVAQARSLLDQAVGRSVKLPPQEREWVREHLVPPRTHLQQSYESLRQKVAQREAEAEASRLR